MIELESGKDLQHVELFSGISASIELDRLGAAGVV